MASALDSSDVAIRLAHEGVPLRAIARAVQIPSSSLREQLHEALSDGRLLALPKDDWPVGLPREQRSLQLSRMVREDKSALSLAVGRIFSLTATEVEIAAGAAAELIFGQGPLRHGGQHC
jgi:hypothetical protein